ncbi:MAG TPA: sigma-70 family RNA polymerase sigma factor [Thermoanaerobaculia bacterium]|nr:sigma-70 family RNA polymerase sigma factor [Thermoanaerobaculia bacterium]
MPQPDALTNDLSVDLDGSFERLVRAFQDRIFSFALRLSGNRQDAEEIAQDAFVRAYRALRTYPADRIRALALQAWLYRIALNVARNRFRVKRARVVSLDARGENGGEASRAREAPADARERPDSRLEEKESRAGIAALVAKLPERYRAPLVLRYVEGLKLDEVAAILEQPVGTAKSNVHRAVNLLRGAISDSRRTKRARS